MKTDIILAGVGGQGILSIAMVLAEAALQEGLHIKQAEVHGMSQRGGDVQSHLRISSERICSDLIPLGRADLILSLEPMEALRYLPFLSAEGVVVSHEKPLINIADYPSEEAIQAAFNDLPHALLFDAEQVAKAEAGTVRAANMVLLGAASMRTQIQMASLEKAIATVFASKGTAVVEANLRALRAGRAIFEKSGR